MGWKYSEIVSTLEEKRKTRAAEFYDAKKKSLALKEKAKANVAKETAPMDKALAELGF